MTWDSGLALLALAVAAFALRASGILLGRLIPSTGKAGQFLREMPGAVMISLAAPAVINGGPAEWLATAATAATAKLTGSLPGSIAVALISVWLLRQAF
jgi:uncharacterized membrane protein